MLLLSLGSLLLGRSVQAQTESASGLRLAAVRAQPADALLFERLRGHIVDLTVRMAEVETTEIRDETDLSAKLDRSASISRQLRAPVVVWFDHDPSGAVTVVIHEVSADRVFVRSAQQAARAPVVGDGPSSGTAEAIALIVRSALGALAQGVSVGEPSEAVIASQARAPSSRSQPWGALAEAGWRFSFDPWLAHQARARIGVRYSVIVAGLAGGYGLDDSRGDEVAVQRFRHHAVAGFLGVLLHPAKRWVLMSTVQAGGMWLRRETEARDPDFVPEPVDWHRSFLLGFDAGAHYRLHGVALVGLTLGIDYSRRRPVIGYVSESVFEPLVRFGHVRPSVLISLAVEVP